MNNATEVKGRDGCEWTLLNGMNTDDIFRLLAKENKLKTVNIDFSDCDEDRDVEELYGGPNGQKVGCSALIIGGMFIEVHFTAEYYRTSSEWDAERFYDHSDMLPGPDAWAEVGSDTWADDNHPSYQDDDEIPLDVLMQSR